MSENKNPVDQLLDLFVYAPLGMAMSVRELLPSMIDKGRQQVTGQVTMAKMIGQFAVQQGQTEAAKAFDRAREQATTALEGFIANGGAWTGATQTSAPTTDAPAGPPTAPAPITDEARASNGVQARRETPARPETTIREAPGPSVRTPARGATPPPAASSTASLPTPQAPPPPVSSLAIPDYDSLSASQVVPRLSGLSASELADVRAYETATRARKTILNKIAQLQAAG